MDDERRRWEDLDTDCLTNVFSRVEMESLFLAVPFVCKSWYKTSLNPLCWKCLWFPDFIPYPLFTDKAEDRLQPAQSFGPFYDQFVDEYRINKTRFSIDAFVKLVVDRSNGIATSLILPEFCTEEALRYVSDACPLLRGVWFTDDLVLFKNSQIIAQVIGKWKFLECLYLGSSLVKIMRQRRLSKKHLREHFKVLLTVENPPCYNVLDRILVQIATHCKHFKELSISFCNVGEIEASTIVKLLPNLKKLDVSSSCIDRDSVVKLLQGLKKVVRFHITRCEGFEESDEEISKLGSQVKHFLCQDCANCDLSWCTIIVKQRKAIFRALELSNQINEG
ncbi:putative F-box domain, leucine-rich repeat domain, L domain-containing protein [Rosa chinensis]|uniref:Putative F-box domain, leucine-rich repeat domain, L domain-containing protein n=1 Tax=Rosa chinensis TaxID=74649 RepID=A0A2P6Q0L3_ROSCH|nr:F-box/LRR-repeat protein At3g48880 [Rosa chinensis]PRQ27730.1 putative F-box domain, leucine-rich repeat domain, L domain-containing protein [Rosa chinensis]